MTTYKVVLGTLSDADKPKAIELYTQLSAIEKLRADIQTKRAAFENTCTEKLGHLQVKENKIRNTIRALITASIETA